MNALFFVKLYALTVPVFLLIDLLWLGVIARGFYSKYLGFIMSPAINWTAAFTFYLLYVAGILVFAVRPAVASGSLRDAAMWGALFGFFTYATYDLTNLATIKDWPLKVVVVDIAWGAVLGAAVAACSFGIGKWLL